MNTRSENDTDLKIVLQTITEIVQRYESGEYLSDDHLKEMHRRLSSNLYYLSQFQAHFKDEWDKFYHESKEKTNAAKERMADRVVPELYMARKISDAGKEVLISIAINLKK